MQTVSVNGKDVFPRAKVVGIEIMQTTLGKTIVAAISDPQSTIPKEAVAQQNAQPKQQVALVTVAPSTATTATTTATPSASSTAAATAATAVIPVTATKAEQPASTSAPVIAEKGTEEASEESSIVTADYIQQST